ncbi:MAG: DUF4011 domain-containing protein, partial [Armatimonadota bacterium]|nr:DUF4011 domain-containing protein [Armatimonadota bacterium]
MDSLISIDVYLSRTVNYAMQQNDVPVIRRLVLHNKTDSALSDIEVHISSDPPFAETSVYRIESMGPRSSYQLSPVNLLLSHVYLSNLTERVNGVVRITAKAGDSYSTSHENISVLAYDEWGGLIEMPELLAAFVLPNHPHVEKVLREAASVLHRWTGDASISGYQSGDKKRVALITAAIYAALQFNNISYINPPASFEQTGQKIRTPDRILSSKLGTCLDLAVLFAACIEQAGLHPLICITSNHAFVGVWLEDHFFHECCTDNTVALKKRIQLNEICAFEATLITSSERPRFDVAAAYTNRYLENLESSCYTIDIRRCRASGIRPLPIRVGGTYAGSALVLPSGSVDPRDQEPSLDFLGESKRFTVKLPEETPASRLEWWKRKLLDLTLHNRLLNFRETKKTLEILCPDIAALQDALAQGETFQLLERPTEFEGFGLRNAMIHRLRTGEEPVERLLREELSAHRLHANVTGTELHRHLTEIYREARLVLEETGANTLYIAIGFLVWYELDVSNPDKRLAPILLIPLEIERQSVHGGFTIRQRDEDPMLNVTLLEFLKHYYDLEVPGVDPIPEDQHGVDVQGVINAFRSAIKEIDSWEVIEKAYLGHFSFEKFLLWRDLDVRQKDLEKNRVVNHLINTPYEQYQSTGAIPDVDSLDETWSPTDILCPLEADSSQLAAIRFAADGNSFVLHGPPGTGKSQTIANMIAHALANGKSVLFVSEKMAALNVVYARLEKCGLGPFCLELHSNKSSKKKVIEELGQALHVVEEKSSDEWRVTAQSVGNLRKKLNEYVQSLHRVRATGENLFHGLSELVRLREVMHLPLGWDENIYVDAKKLEAVRDCVERLQVAARELPHPSTSVWSAVSFEDYTDDWQSAVEQ